MDILLLEDDPLMAELVELVLSGTIAGAKVHHTAQVSQAKAAWKAQPAQLVICDQHLQDGSGLDLVKLIRSEDKTTPIVMISAHSDREAVVSALHYGISEFIAKPFDVIMLQQRLLPILQSLPNAGTGEPSKPELEAWLAQALAEKLRMPSELSPENILPLLAQSDELSCSELARLWQKETTLSARLLNVANSASLKRSGTPLSRLDDAISTLGIEMALRIAMALALDITGSLSDERLVAFALHHHSAAEQVASIARAMAISIGLDGLSCYTAGLLSRAGELSVLRTLQDFITQGGSLDESQITSQLAEWSPRYGNRLKQQWGLPIPVRELIGAVHVAPSHATQRSLLVMHLAGLRVASQLHTPEALRMLRQSGLDIDKWAPQKAEDTAAKAQILAEENHNDTRS
ncbi:response regulator [Oceanisphaera marina]|uniref:Response regulator n=1 Tax=Oceanisphaera marina TaxID=2017550 RepID=A0ABQ1IK78_9GAMM|nr:response regulator [Oceanisphaera marina]GGB43529.1 response regulator [Oceanisphaera marina]